VRRIATLTRRKVRTPHTKNNNNTNAKKTTSPMQEEQRHHARRAIALTQEKQ
jgi:hypothetical protein